MWWCHAMFWSSWPWPEILAWNLCWICEAQLNSSLMTYEYSVRRKICSDHSICKFACEKREKYFLKCQLKWLYLYSRSSNREPESQASHVFVLILSSSSERLCESEFETALGWPMGTSLYHMIRTALIITTLCYGSLLHICSSSCVI